MENTETIKRKTRKRRRRERQTLSLSNSTPSFPLELSSEILSKLPAKSVLRFRCVSKLWSSITKEPYFTKSFQTPPSLLLFFKEGDKFFVFSIQQHNPNPNESYSYSTSQPIDSYNITYPKSCSFTTKTESVHGLICFYRSSTPIIWNPSIRKFSILPQPDTSWKGIQIFLGYDPIEGKHKIVSFPYGGSIELYNECRVLTLGPDQEKTWRTVKTEHNHRTFTDQIRIRGRCINGVLFYQAYRLVNKLYVHVIMSFDVKSEKLGLIELPPWGQNIWRTEMISYEGKLAFVDSKGNSITIWILENAEKCEWSNHLVSPLTQYYEVPLTKRFNLIGCTDDGELIYAPKSCLKCFDIIYIDPKRVTFRRVGYSGIMDDDFRQRNGIGDKRLNFLQFFPNHIETLLPFPHG